MAVEMTSHLLPLLLKQGGVNKPSVIHISYSLIILFKYIPTLPYLSNSICLFPAQQAKFRQTKDTFPPPCVHCVVVYDWYSTVFLVTLVTHAPHMLWCKWDRSVILPCVMQVHSGKAHKMNHQVNQENCPEAIIHNYMKPTCFTGTSDHQIKSFISLWQTMGCI